MAESLFRILLGDDLNQLSGSLKAFYENPREVKGHLDVYHEPGLSNMLFIKMLQLPKAGTHLPTHLRIESAQNSEIWQRTIGGSRFRSAHRVVDNLLEEKSGPLRIRYRIGIEGGEVHYHQESISLLGIPLPARLSPTIQAIARGDEGGWTLDLTVSCPRRGPFFGYKGRLEIV